MGVVTMTEDVDSNRLAYAVEWGGRAWISLVEEGLGSIEVAGRHVLEIGGRSGRMAAYLASLGAEVTTIDIDAGILESAPAEAARLGVAVTAQTDPGDLSSVPDNAFDLVFTKSVLVAVPDLDRYLDAVVRKLHPGGHLISIENAEGHRVLAPIRRLRHGRALRTYRMFDEAQWRLVKQRFEPLYWRHSVLPPVDLFVGVRR